jgi:transcriptional regulator of acetoin/glycerol metabolism
MDLTPSSDHQQPTASPQVGQCQKLVPQRCLRSLAKLNAITRAGAAQRIKDGASPEQVAAELGVSRSTLYRELRKHRDSTVIEPD